MDLKETEILGSSINKHWYYSSKVKAMMGFLGEITPRKILDVGAGSGFFSKYLLEHTAASEAWCVDISYPQEMDEKFSGKPVYLRTSIEHTDTDLVLLMDVLEHVDDDVSLLNHYVEKVPSGARFLITVPAFQFLWSGHDIFLDHKRRYTLSQLEQVAKDAGLDLLKGSYYFGGVFPIAALLRLMERLTPKPDAVRSQLARHGFLANLLLKTICLIELPLMRFNRLAGLTVFCMAEKR